MKDEKRITITPHNQTDKMVAEALEQVVNQPDILAQVERQIFEEIRDLYLYGKKK